jgi:hypothetical protein
MPRKPKLFDYSQLSDFREYAPLNSDPTDFDVSRVTEKNCRDCTTPLDLISGVDETTGDIRGDCGLQQLRLVVSVLRWIQPRRLF